ncbi:MAG TPA: DUF3667 domain-containing protein [Thermoanaerobaculia bacterium]|nr:DUF3667 domain-containing protein [Thermoanaerobaculia bacterium]
MSHAATEPDCLNCGAELQGKFCHVCGQKAASVHLGMHDFVHEATHEFLHLDGKILQTVKLLVVKPGELTRQFLEGRRVRYITPVRLYLTFSLIFFTLAALLPGATEGMVKVNRTGLNQDTELERRIEGGLLKAEQENEKLGQAVLHNLPRVMFVLMPIFALVTWAFYRKQQRYYIAHLYYSIHFHAFTFLVMTLYILLARLVLPKPVAALLILTVLPYHFIALRRVFGGSRAVTFSKGLAIGVLYWILALTAVMVSVLTILMSL